MSQAKRRWSEGTTLEEASKLAGGRRAYNRWRQCVALERQIAVLERIEAKGWVYGLQAQLARDLKVSEATISRDIQAIWRDGEIDQCPACGQMVFQHPRAWQDREAHLVEAVCSWDPKLRGRHEEILAGLAECRALATQKKV